MYWACTERGIIYKWEVAAAQEENMRKGPGTKPCPSAQLTEVMEGNTIACFLPFASGGISLFPHTSLLLVPYTLLLGSSPSAPLTHRSIGYYELYR